MEGDITRPVGFPSLRGVFYGWWLVALGAVALAIFQGDATTYIERALLTVGDWWSAQFALAWSITGAVPWLLLPLFGWAVDRWGPRRLVVLGLGIFALGALVSAASAHVAAFLAAALLLGLGAGIGAPLPIMAMLNNWFQRRRAMARAIALLPSSLVAALVAQVDFSPGVLQELYGPAASVVLAALVVVGIWPALRWLADSPESRGLTPDGIIRPESGDSPNPDRRDPQPLPDWLISEALKYRDFWLMLGARCAAAIANSLAFTAAPLVHVAFATGGPSYVVLHPFHLAGYPVGVLLGGLIGGRIALRWAMFWFAAVQATAVMLSFAVATFDNFSGFRLATAFLFGVGSGGGYLLGFAMRGAYFGKLSFGMINSIILFAEVPAGLAGGVGLLAAFRLLLFPEGGVSVAAIVVLAAAATAFAVAGVGAYLLLGSPRLAPSQIGTSNANI